MLEIKVINGEICAVSEDWTNIENNERDFFSKCYFSGLLWAEQPGGNLKLSIAGHRATEDLKRLNKLTKICDEYRISLPDEYYVQLKELGEKAKEEERLSEISAAEQRQLDEWNRQIIKANRRMTEGCGLCIFLRVNNGMAYCKAAERNCRKRADEVEEELYAKRESKHTGEKCEYYANPYPCVDCPELIQGRRALERRSLWLELQEENK